MDTETGTLPTKKQVDAMFKSQFKYWVSGLAVFICMLWLLGDILFPFFIAAAIAYLLDPVATKMQKWGMTRVKATTLIASLALILILAALLVLIPRLISETTALFHNAPHLIRSLQDQIYATFPHLLEPGSPSRHALLAIGETLKTKGVVMLNTALASTTSIFTILMMLIITPVATFYLLLDWRRIIENIDYLLPRSHAPVIRVLVKRIDSALSSFLRGMLTVCVILGTFYAVLLSVAGLQFGLVVGVIAGLLTFIPYVGAIAGGVFAIGLAVVQFWGEWHVVLAIAGIFGVGQILETNIITPKLVGDSVRIHPVLLMLAIAMFAGLFGAGGALIAIPATAALGVLIRYATERYIQSDVYQAEEEG